MCAGSVGDVVIATKTVEYDMRNRFSPPHLPRFRTAEHVLELCRSVLQAERAFQVHYGLGCQWG